MAAAFAGFALKKSNERALKTRFCLSAASLAGLASDFDF